MNREKRRRKKSTKTKQKKEEKLRKQGNAIPNVQEVLSNFHILTIQKRTRLFGYAVDPP